MASPNPAMWRARMLWQAVTPLPHELITGSDASMPSWTKRLASCSGDLNRPSPSRFPAVGADTGRGYVARGRVDGLDLAPVSLCAPSVDQLDVPEVGSSCRG